MPSVPGVDDNVPPTGYGVYGRSNRGGYGVVAESNSVAVNGTSVQDIGVRGHSDSSYGVSGSSSLPRRSLWLKSQRLGRGWLYQQRQQL